MKIGDKVIILENCWHTPSRGSTGVIYRVDTRSFCIYMDFPDEFTFLWVEKNCVESVNKKPKHVCKGLIMCKKCIKNIRKIL